MTILFEADSRLLIGSHPESRKNIKKRVIFLSTASMSTHSAIRGVTLFNEVTTDFRTHPLLEQFQLISSIIESYDKFSCTQSAGTVLKISYYFSDFFNLTVTLIMTVSSGS